MDGCPSCEIRHFRHLYDTVFRCRAWKHEVSSSRDEKSMNQVDGFLSITIFAAMVSFTPTVAFERPRRPYNGRKQRLCDQSIMFGYLQWGSAAVPRYLNSQQGKPRKTGPVHAPPASLHAGGQ